MGPQPQRAPDGASVHDEHHRPEQTTLYPISVYLHQLRKKLGADLLHTVRGLGYDAGPEKR